VPLATTAWKCCWIHACNIWRSATVGWTFKSFCAALAQNKHRVCMKSVNQQSDLSISISARTEREKITQISTGESIIQINTILRSNSFARSHDDTFIKFDFSYQSARLTTSWLLDWLDQSCTLQVSGGISMMRWQWVDSITNAHLLI